MKPVGSRGGDRRKSWVFAIVTCAALQSLPAAAKNPHHAKFLQLVRKGEAEYQSGHYAEAAATLQQAYGVEANDRVLYNIARALDQANEVAGALDYYEKYLGSEHKDSKLAERASLSVDRLRALSAKQEAEAKKQAEERAAVEAKSKEAEERAKAEADAARRAQADAEAQAEARRRALVDAELASRKRMRVTSLTVGGAGIAAAGLGVAFGVLANSSHSQFTQATTAADKDSLESTTRTRALVADVGYGVAILGLGAAVLLYPKGKGPSSVTLWPTTNGFALSGEF